MVGDSKKIHLVYFIPQVKKTLKTSLVYLRGLEIEDLNE